MLLFHRTLREHAAQILREGFRDGAGHCLTDKVWRGIWLSDRPLDANVGADGDVLLQVTLSCAAETIGEFEWVEPGKSYREWLVPANLINERGTVAIANVSEQRDDVRSS